MGVFAHTSCAGKVRTIQNFHMDSRGWADIAYNFIVCPHGYTFEGRGWGKRSAANGTNAGNDAYHAVCYLGGDGDPFTDEAKGQFVAVRDAWQGRYARTALIRPHSSFLATACPGNVIRQWITDGLPGGAPAPAPTPTPTPPAADWTEEAIMALPTLKLGATGQHVRILQALLVVAANDLMHEGHIDGDFGPHTENVLRVWQGRTGKLTADGVCGPATWKWLIGA